MSERITKTVAYLANSLTTLGVLESSCNRDESYLGKVINIELATIESSSGAKAVAITYEAVDPFDSGINLGHLSLKAYSNTAEENLLKVQFLQARCTPVLPGGNPDTNSSRAKAYIQNDTVKFLIFREEAGI